jgi:Tol biopolymer transport system component
MRQITMDPMPDWAPSWSPDGKSVAFYSARSGNREIWVQPLTGGSARQITRGPQQSTYPAWSPDGESLAFERNGEICTVPASGGEPRCFKQMPRAFFPAWSPDGRWLAFQFGGPPGTLARMTADGGSVLRLKAGTGVTSPRWSPDQEWIYAVSRHNTFRDVWGFTPDGTRERQITNLAGAQYGAVEVIGLATDGRHVFIVWRGDISDVWIADLVQQ